MFNEWIKRFGGNSGPVLFVSEKVRFGLPAGIQCEISTPLAQDVLGGMLGCVNPDLCPSVRGG